MLRVSRLGLQLWSLMLTSTEIIIALIGYAIDLQWGIRCLRMGRLQKLPVSMNRIRFVLAREMEDRQRPASKDCTGSIAPKSKFTR